MGFKESHLIVKSLVNDFRENEKYYLSPGYSEIDARRDFIDKFFTALGWDVTHDVQKNPYEQEVRVERLVQVAKAQKRADYSFYLKPNFRDVKFFVEAKKPVRNLQNADDFFQTIRYGWNANTPIAILTDFEEFIILDCRFRPDIGDILNSKIEKFHYTDYLIEEKFRRIYHLFSYEAVADGSIEKYAEALPKPKKKDKQKRVVNRVYQSIDDAFLEELDDIRLSLAKAFKKTNQHLTSEELTEATQRVIDRLVFIRFLEDKLIEPHHYLSEFGKRRSAWEDFISVSRTLDAKYNGVVFKKHQIDSQNIFDPDDKTFSLVCDDLSHYNSPYDFDKIPIHILGSIYERFLGKTIEATDKRVRIEEKPEVRKAGGVYYTPQYIVNYIVDNTVGKLIDGKTPKQIAKMRFADIACGSGSFLITVFDKLLEYHKKWYQANPEQAKKDGCALVEGTYRLTLSQKQKILTNNIYGVDIDPQAVEVTQLSLYLKLLEDETTATANDTWVLFKEQLLPNLNKNIICGNSLIGTDILNDNLFGFDEERKLKPMDFENVFPEIMKDGGFDSIVGNPPYVGIHQFVSTTNYFSNKYLVAKGQYNLFSLFIEKAIKCLKVEGLFGYIVPSLFIKGVHHKPLRSFINSNAKEFKLIEHGDKVFKKVQMPTCTFILRKGNQRENDFFENKALRIFAKYDTVLLEEISIIRRGIEIGKDKLVEEGKVKCIVGADLDVYFIKRISTITERTFEEFQKEPEIFKSPKIIVRETGNRFFASLDYEDLITSRSIYNVKIKDADYPIELILGIINSSLFKFYFRNFIAPDTNIFPKIRIVQLRQLPIPKLDSRNRNEEVIQGIVRRINEILTSKKQLQHAKTDSDKNYLQRKCERIDKEIDQLVYNLYGLTEEEIKIVEGE